MAELSHFSHLRRGQVQRDQWYAELLRLATEDGYVSDDPDENYASAVRFAGDDPASPSRVRGGSAASVLGPSPLWDQAYAAELSPVEALEGALAAVELDAAEREAADDDAEAPEAEAAADPVQDEDRDHPAVADEDPDAFGGQVFAEDGPEDESRSEDPHPADPFTPAEQDEVVPGSTVARSREDVLSEDDDA